MTDWSAEIDTNDQITRLHAMASDEPVGGQGSWAGDIISLGAIAALCALLWLLCWVLA